MIKLQETVKTGKHGVLQFMGTQRVRHDLATEQQQSKQCGIQRNRIKSPEVEPHIVISLSIKEKKQLHGESIVLTNGVKIIRYP